MKTNNRLTPYKEGSIKELATIAFPLILTALSGNLMLFLDRVIVARYSTDALNAVATASILCALFQYGVVGISSIAEVFVGQYNGAKQKDKLGEPAWQMVWFSLSTLILFIPLAFYSGSYLLPENLLGDALPYYKLILIFGPLLGIIAALSAFFVGQGKVKIIFMTTLVGNVANLGLDIIFVFGIKGWIPQMGTQGAALATVISQLLQVIILGSYFLSSNSRSQYGTNDWHFKKKPFLDCLKIGFPNAISHMIEISAWSLLIILMAKAGEAYITVLAVGQSFCIVIAFYNDGMQKGIITIAANLIGQKKPYLVSKMVNSGIVLQLLVAFLFAIPLFLFPDLCLRIFFSEETYTVNKTVVPYLHVALAGVWVFFVFDGLTWIFAGILTAGGDTKFNMYMNGIAAWFFCIVPCYFFIVKIQASPKAIWFIVASYALLNSTAFYLRYRGHKWRSNKVLESAKEIVEA